MKKSEIILICIIVLFIAGFFAFVQLGRGPDGKSVLFSGTPTPYTPRPTVTVSDGSKSAPLGVTQEKVIPTVPPTPTINPKLLIRYEEERVNERTGKTYTQCLIKGNINSKGEKIYHVPGSPSYDSTKIDVLNGEHWFCTEYEALRAGWHAPGQ